MHALDRPTQMLFARAVASGRSAEQIADKDRTARNRPLLPPRRAVPEPRSRSRQLDDDTFAELTAYCEGVNDGMKESGRSLPMWATGFMPSLGTSRRCC